MDELYAILELHAGASDEEVKRNYRKLVMLYHPDMNPSPEAHTKFLEIQRAYEILTDSQARAKYLYQNNSVSEATHSASETQKYRRSNYRKKDKMSFDPTNHIPIYEESFFDASDFDFFAFTRIFLLGFVGAIVTFFIARFLVLDLYMLFLPSYLVIAFMLFDAVLWYDLTTRNVLFHAFIIKIIYAPRRKMYAFFMSVDDNPRGSFSVKEVRSSDRYRNYYYTREIKFDYEKMPSFAIRRTLLLRICLGIEGHGPRIEVDLDYFKKRKKNLKLFLPILLSIGALLLIFQYGAYAYYAGFAYFFGHFFFIRKYVTSNIMD